MGKFPFKRPRIISKKFPEIDSHIDGVTKSLEGLVFSYTEKVDRALQKKHLMMAMSSMVLLIVLGSFISPKGKAESSIFYPESCLGGWINPYLAQGELETTSNADESQFTPENSAALPKNTNAELYCGSFRGTFSQDTKPTKIIVSLALTQASEVIPHVPALDSVPSVVDTSTTTSPLNDNASTTTDDLILASTTIDQIQEGVSSSSSLLATTTEEIVVPATSTVQAEALSTPSVVDGIVETVKNTFIDLFENSGNVVPETDTVVLPTPAPEVEASPAPETPPVSFLKNFKNDLVTYFVPTVFAETSTSTSTDATSTMAVPISTSTEIYVDPSSTSSSSEISLLDSTSTFSTTTIEVATSSLSVDDNTFQNNFLEVLYTLDGISWISLGELNEISMKYRTFEIPVTASTSWSDMDNLQIKVISKKETKETPALYLDGIKVEVLYDSAVLQMHPDFARDTILKDEIVDGVRVVTIINNDTNVEEVWYMLLEAPVSTSTLVLVENSTTTFSISSTTPEIAASASTTDLLATTTEDFQTASTSSVPVVNLLKISWVKYEGDTSKIAVTELVKEIKKIEEEKEGLAAIVLPDFAIDTLRRVKGVFREAIVIQVEKTDKDRVRDELWLYNLDTGTQDRIEIGTGTPATIAQGTSLGLKGGYLFWLSVDRKIVYAFNLQSKKLLEKELPVIDASEGQRAEIHFEEIPWQVIVSNEGFTFFSPDHGEVFSDEDSRVVEELRIKIGLDDLLEKEELSNLNLPVTAEDIP